MKKILLLVLACTVCLLSCSEKSKPADGSQSADQGKRKKEFITIATGGSSGNYFALGGALSNLLNENYDYINSSVESTGASVVNTIKIGANEAQVAFAMNNAVSDGYNGVNSFKESGKIENVRAIASLYPNFCQAITIEDTGIKSIYDLKGKRVGVGAPGSGTEMDARSLLAIHGLSYDDIKPDYLSYKEAVEQMKNGTVDAVFLTSGLPNSSILDLVTTHDVVPIPIEADKVAELAETIPFYSSEIIPAGLYDNDTDVPTAAVSTLLITNSDTSEETVYDITKALFENLDTMIATNKAAEKITLDTVEVGIPVPFHDGSIKYYKEIGLMK